MKEEDKRTEQYEYKACPFRQGHFCGKCELLIPKIKMCVLKCMNANLGLLAKFITQDEKTMEKIKEELRPE